MNDYDELEQDAAFVARMDAEYALVEEEQAETQAREQYAVWLQDRLSDGWTAEESTMEDWSDALVAVYDA